MGLKDGLRRNLEHQVDVDLLVRSGHCELAPEPVIEKGPGGFKLNLNLFKPNGDASNGDESPIPPAETRTPKTSTLNQAEVYIQ